MSLLSSFVKNPGKTLSKGLGLEGIKMPSTDIKKADTASVEKEKKKTGQLQTSFQAQLDKLRETPTVGEPLAPPPSAVIQQTAQAPTTMERLAPPQAAQIGVLGRFDAAQIDPRQQAQLRQLQLQQIQGLQQQAQGVGPSIADLQGQRQLEQQIASQQALAATSGDPAAQRMAQRNALLAAQQIGGTVAEQKIAEQAQARAQLSDILGQTRAADIGLATTQAQLQQQAGLAGADAQTRAALEQARLQQQAGLTGFEAQASQIGTEFQAAQQAAALAQARAIQQAQLDQQMAQMGFGAATDMQKLQASLKAQEQANLLDQIAALQRTQLGVETGAIQTEQSRLGAEAAAKAQQQSALFGGLMQAGGAMGAAFLSDKTTKKNVKKINDKNIKSFLNALNGKSYEYKDPTVPGTKAGKRYGIIAQDLNKTSIGRSMISRNQDNKLQVDPVRTVETSLAALASLNKRLEKLEAANGK